MGLQIARRFRKHVGWVLVGAVVVLIPLTITMVHATLNPRQDTQWMGLPLANLPPQKAQIFENERQQLDAARAHPRPRPPVLNLQALPYKPDPTPQAGIQSDMHEGPFPAMSFLVSDLWQGPVGNDWILVYAGSQHDPIGGVALHGALRLYKELLDQYGGHYLVPIGIYPAPTSTSSVTITAYTGSVLSLDAGDGRTLSFNLDAKQYH